MIRREESDFRLVKKGQSYFIGNCDSDYSYDEIPWDDRCAIQLSDSYTAAGVVVRRGRKYAYFYYNGGGGGCPIEYKSDIEPFTFDDIRVLGGYDYSMRNEYVGYLAFRKGRKWGVYRLADIGGMVRYLAGPFKLIVPCKYNTFEDAANQIHEPAYFAYANEWVTYEQMCQPTYDDAPQMNDVSDSMVTTPTYIRRWFTPDHINRLKNNQIFVFGSNLAGEHGGGAAAYAMRHFGAKWGEGVGRTGQCYAIPTMHGGIDTVRPYIDAFIDYAGSHPELEFLVTPIGCGIAGFTPDQMAPLFARALQHGNIVLPESFVHVISPKI